jgi:hypothetical protein
MNVYDIKGKWESLGDIGFDKAVGRLARIKEKCLKNIGEDWWEEEEWSDPTENLELHGLLIVMNDMSYGVIGSHAKVYSFKYGGVCYLHYTAIEVKKCP